MNVMHYCMYIKYVVVVPYMYNSSCTSRFNCLSLQSTISGYSIEGYKAWVLRIVAVFITTGQIHSPYISFKRITRNNKCN